MRRNLRQLASTRVEVSCSVICTKDKSGSSQQEQQQDTKKQSVARHARPTRASAHCFHAGTRHRERCYSVNDARKIPLKRAPPRFQVINVTHETNANIFHRFRHLGLLRPKQKACHAHNRPLIGATVMPTLDAFQSFWRRNTRTRRKSECDLLNPFEARVQRQKKRPLRYLQASTPQQ